MSPIRLKLVLSTSSQSTRVTPSISSSGCAPTKRETASSICMSFSIRIAMFPALWRATSRSPERVSSRSVPVTLRI